MPKNKKVSMLKTMLIALAAVLLVLVPVRCYQFASGLLEPGTGFYKDGSPSIWVSYILLAAASAAFLIIAIVNRKRISYSTEKFGSTGLAIAAFMFALTLIIDAVMQYKTVFDTATDSAIMYGTESVQYLKTGLVSRGLEGFCAIVSAVFFVLFGYGHLKGKSNASESKLMALFPVLWCIFRLMHRFMRTINFLNVSELLYELFMCVFLMAFLMAFSQLNSKVGNDKFDWKLVGYGLPAMLFSVLCFLPRFIMTLVGKSYVLCSQSPIEWCDLGAAVFICALLLTRLTFGEKDIQTAAADENTES